MQLDSSLLENWVVTISLLPAQPAHAYGKIIVSPSQGLMTTLDITHEMVLQMKTPGYD